MLRFLQISDFALITEARIEFQRGLTVLTGETGAGKSLVLDALGLLAGMRASPSFVRTGAARAVVEALFEIPADSPAIALLEEAGLEPEDNGEVIIRREILATGRGRVSINGRLVPLSTLEQLAPHFLEIGNQHEQFALLNSDAQQELFDQFAGLLPLRAKFTEAWGAMAATRRAIEERHGADRDRQQRADFLRFQVDELESAALQPGELTRLEAEVTRLSHVEELVHLGSQADAQLSGDGGECRGARDLLSQALRVVERMAAHDPALAHVVATLERADDALAEGSFALSSYLERLEVDPARLSEVSERLDTLRRLLRKHGPSEEDALGRLEELRSELDELDQWEESGERLDQQLAATTARAAALARDLSAARRKAVSKFTRPLVAILKDFALPKVRVEVELKVPTGGIALDDGMRCDSRGAEQVEILFSANEGEAPQPLRRIGSGGELSRVMLALRTLAGEASRVPLMIFDEVDAGISGNAARNVAQRLAALGRAAQIIAVTHNPTVAAHADYHLLVEKFSDGGRTTSAIHLLAPGERQEELARLLDGGKLSQRSLALAEELLQQTA